MNFCPGLCFSVCYDRSAYGIYSSEFDMLDVMECVEAGPASFWQVEIFHAYGCSKNSLLHFYFNYYFDCVIRLSYKTCLFSQLKQ